VYEILSTNLRIALKCDLKCLDKNYLEKEFSREEKERLGVPMLDL